MTRLSADLNLLSGTTINVAPAVIEAIEITDAAAMNAIFSDDNSDDGRSQFFLIGLANGDQMVAFYPQGGTLIELEDSIEDDPTLFTADDLALAQRLGIR